MHVTARLHQSITQPLPPAAVCSLILDHCGSRLSRPDRELVHRACQEGPSDPVPHPDLVPLVAAVHKVRTLYKLLGQPVPPPEKVQKIAGDPWLLMGYLAGMAPFVGWMDGDFARLRRLNRTERADLHLDLPRRRYNRVVRQLRRTQAHAAALKEQVLLRQMCMLARVGPAYVITEQDMCDHPEAAAFAAYYAARRHDLIGRRVAAGDAEVMDPVAQALLARCHERCSPAGWWLVAQVRPAAAVWLPEDLRGELLSWWVDFMRLTADRLARLHERWPDGVQWNRMQTRPGLPWTTWNTVAWCYNAAREGWLDALGAVGALRLLNPLCPGKALLFGHNDPAELSVWSSLPTPWEALAGREPCTARMVLLTAARAGLDLIEAGWVPAPVAGLDDPPPVSVRLAHAIQEYDPGWAAVLVRAGVFDQLNGRSARLPTSPRP